MYNWYDFVGLELFQHRSLVSSKEIKNRIEDALERVGLFEKSNYHISQFSGGDRQRTKFDRAVCQTQKLLLLDEPTNHHDQAAKGPLLNAAMQLGIKVVTALHDLTLIDDFATHVVDLKKWMFSRNRSPIWHNKSSNNSRNFWCSNVPSATSQWATHALIFRCNDEWTEGILCK